MRASFLELYNENIRDLLSKNPNAFLDLKETPDQGGGGGGANNERPRLESKAPHLVSKVHTTLNEMNYKTCSFKIEPPWLVWFFLSLRHCTKGCT